MLDRILSLSLRHRLIVGLAVAMLAALGLRDLARLPVDAFPDTTPVQVQVNTTAPALGPMEIEREITQHVEAAISGLPGLAQVRSISKFGLSQVVANFTEGTDIYRARQLVMERIAGVELGEKIERPSLGPISTGLGEIFHYILSSPEGSHSLEEIRTLHDWVLKPEMAKVPGVAEINSWGGFELQYQVIVSPDALVERGLTLQDIFEALRRNNANVGGGRIVLGGQALLVQGLGRVADVEDIGSIVIRATDGIPTLISDVADVQKGHEIRQGAVTAQGQGEALLGLGFMLMGENSRDVAQRLRERLAEAQAFLPEGIEVEVVYDRTDLVDQVIGTVKHNLLFGALLVIGTLFLILGDWRAGLAVAVAIPLAMCFAVVGMYHFAIAASLLSLGAMDFGLLVDGSVVMADANRRHLLEEAARLGRKLTPAERLRCVLQSGREVARPIAFGMGIIAVVFLPVLTLEGVEGRMFRPMAFTFIFALLGALVIALTLSPVLSAMFFKASPPAGGKEPDIGLGSDASHKKKPLDLGYRKALEGALDHPRALAGATLLLLVLGGAAIWRLGGEFIPRLSEGSIVINVVRLAGVSIEESTAYNTRIEKLLLDSFPDEVDRVWSRIGTAEVATDPMGTELTDIFLKLHLRKKWTRAASQQELVSAIESELSDLPGINALYSQPIEMRLNEMISGIRSDIAVQIRGDDLDELVRLSDAVQSVLLTIEGSADVSGDQVTGQPMVQVLVDREAAARHGIAVEHVLDFVAAVGNVEVGEVYDGDGQRVFPLTVRLPEGQRRDPELLGNTLVPTTSGLAIPLRQLARIQEVEGPATINREWGRRVIRAQSNVRERDVASFVREAKEKVAEQVALPEGYVLEWGGQFENLQRSQARLAIVVPVSLLLVLLLLRLSLGNLRDALLIFSAIPLAAVGGALLLWWRDMPFSVSAAVGFIALAGIAVLNGQVLVTALRRHVRRNGLSRQGVLEASGSRLRPVLATAITDMAGFLPMALSVGVGAEVQRPLATVVVGGVVTSTLLTLFVLPWLYSRWGWTEPAATRY